MVKFLSWNVNGLGTRWPELLQLITEEAPGVVFLQETMLAPGADLPPVQGYTTYRADRAGRRGGGVAILVHHSLRHTPYNLGFLGISSIEAVGVRIKGAQGPIILLSVYLPPNTATKRDLFKIPAVGEAFIAFGDLNARHPAWGAPRPNRIGACLHQLVVEDGLNLFVPTGPTRRARRRNEEDSTLDMLLASNNISEARLEVIREFTSDHFPVVAEVDITIKSSSASARLETNWYKYQRELDRPWEVPDDVNEAVAVFTAAVQAAFLNASAPVPSKTARLQKLPRDLQAKIAHRKKLEVQARRPGAAGRLARTALNSLRKELSREVKAFHAVQKAKLIAQLEDPVLRWQVLRRGRPVPPPLPQLAHQGCVANTKQEKVDMLAAALEVKFRENPGVQCPALRAAVEQSATFYSTHTATEGLPVVDLEKLEEVLKHCKNKSQPGPDGITYVMLKHLPASAKYFFVAIANKVIRGQVWPDLFKAANVTMLLKEGKDPRHPDSYRPISLLSCPGKVLERLILPFFNRGKIPDHQFGFRRKHNTTLQLQRLTNQCAKTINLGEGGLIISLDVEAAFDRVPHKELVHKLVLTSQPGWLIALTASYLADRSFSVCVDGRRSGLKPIAAGTPQGAVWSPPLFNLYIHDSPGESSAVFQYADDTAFFVRGHYQQLNREGNEAMRRFGEWCDSWKVKVNASKSQALVLQGTKGRRKVSISFQGTTIPHTNTIKYLGIHVDCKLNFNNHVDYLVSKAKRKTASLLQFVRHKGLSSATKSLLYTCLIQSALIYGLPAWDMLSQTNLDKIRVFERKWVRICAGTRFSRDIPRLEVEKSSSFPLFIMQTNRIAAENFLALEEHPNPLVRAMANGTDAIPQDSRVPAVDRVLMHLNS